MHLEMAVEMAQRTLVLALELGAPLLLVALAVGFVFAILQAMTHIEEADLSRVPRLLAVAGVSVLLLPWFLEALSEYTRDVFLLLASEAVLEGS